MLYFMKVTIINGSLDDDPFRLDFIQFAEVSIPKLDFV